MRVEEAAACETKSTAGRRGGTQRFNTRLYADEMPYNQGALGSPTRVVDNELNLVLRGVVTVSGTQGAPWDWWPCCREPATNAKPRLLQVIKNTFTFTFVSQGV